MIAQGELVTIEKALTRMSEYKQNKETVQELRAQRQHDIGYNLTQDISTADGSQHTQYGHTDTTARNALDRVENKSALEDIYEWRVQWVDERRHLITRDDDRRAVVFALRLEGCTHFEIAAITRKSEKHVRTLLRECAEILMDEEE